MPNSVQVDICDIDSHLYFWFSVRAKLTEGSDDTQMCECVRKYTKVSSWSSLVYVARPSHSSVTIIAGKEVMWATY